MTGGRERRQRGNGPNEAKYPEESPHDPPFAPENSGRSAWLSIERQGPSWSRRGASEASAAPAARSKAQGESPPRLKRCQVDAASNSLEAQRKQRRLGERPLTRRLSGDRRYSTVAHPNHAQRSAAQRDSGSSTGSSTGLHFSHVSHVSLGLAMRFPHSSDRRDGPAWIRTWDQRILSVEVPRDPMSPRVPWSDLWSETSDQHRPLKTASGAAGAAQNRQIRPHAT